MLHLHIHVEANIQKVFLQIATELVLLPDTLEKLASKRSRFVTITLHHARKYFTSRLENQTACTAPVIAVLDMRATVLK
jgi:hypothetical protein